VRNYVECHTFAESCAQFMSDHERRRWNNHPVAVEFKNKWKTQVYFAVRQKEIGAQLKNASETGEYTFQGQKLCLRASLELWTLIDRCWDSDVFLPPLFPQFFRLCFEMMAKYLDMVKTLGQKSPVIGDIFATVALLKTHFRDTALKHTKAATVDACIDIMVTEAEKCATNVADALHALTLETVAKELRAVKGIPPLYRLTDRPAPTEASAYVDAVLKAIDGFERKIAIYPNRAEALQHCVEAAFGALTDEISTMLQGLEQLEKSLQKLRTASARGISPNIFKQVRLDVDLFQARCRELYGVNLESFEISVP